MRLKQCALMNFRNYVSQKLTFHPQLTVLVGANAQGKTNFLEALYVCARGRTFKSNTEKELIRFGAQDAYVLADIEREHIEKRVEIKFANRSKKRIRINGIEIAQIKDLVYQFDVVLFAPEHLQMVQSGPQFRREFIDDLLRGIDPLYEKRMQYYQKVLRQRNQFLKKKKDTWYAAQKKIWDQQLASASYPIARSRVWLCAWLSKIAERAHCDISQQKERLQISYRMSFSWDWNKALPVMNTGDALDRPLLSELHAQRGKRAEEEKERYVQRMIQALADRADEEERFLSTRVGPHLDDVQILIDGKGARSFASQGQARTAVLALKLAELWMLEKCNGSKPILLLDDVFSELDQHRASHLLQAIARYQTILTTTDLSLFPIQEAAIYEIRAGVVQPVVPTGNRKEPYDKTKL